MSDMDLPAPAGRPAATAAPTAITGDCVEVALLPGGAAAVRDSKHRDGGRHRHSAAAWRAFLVAVRADEFSPG